MNTVSIVKTPRFYATLALLPAILFPNNNSLNYFRIFPPVAPVFYCISAGDNIPLRIGASGRIFEMW
jgi:hypothetical protein